MNQEKQEIRITTHDRLMRAWQNSMELTRDFEIYSKEIDDPQVQSVFSDFAVDEGKHAARFRDLLIEGQSQN